MREMIQWNSSIVLLKYDISTNLPLRDLLNYLCSNDFSIYKIL